jgi:hypothetical protein
MHLRINRHCGDGGGEPLPSMLKAGITIIASPSSRAREPRSGHCHLLQAETP